MFLFQGICLFIVFNSIFKFDISSIIDGIKDFTFSSSSIKPEKVTDMSFQDVKGIDEFREELEEIVEFLKNPEKYKSMGAEVPKGVLLSGPPGTGKTLLARALAGEAGCKFFYKSGAEFDEVYVRNEQLLTPIRSEKVLPELENCSRLPEKMLQPSCLLMKLTP